MEQMIIFRVATEQFAIHLESIKCITPIVKIDPIPKAKDHVMGMINMHGQPVYVLDTWKLLDLPSKKIELSDLLLVLPRGKDSIALLIDEVLETLECNKEDLIDTDEKTQKASFVNRSIRYKDKTTFLLELDKCLSLV